MAVYFNKEIRCYEDGRVERLIKNKEWREVPNTENANGYNRIRHRLKNIYRHRLIASCFLGLNCDDPSQTVDHINRIRTDNRVENLRIISQQQQLFNKGEPKGYRKKRNRWEAFIVLNKKQIYLGLFKTEKEAGQAYLDAKAIYHII